MKYLIKVVNGVVADSVVASKNFQITDNTAGEWVLSETNYGKGYNYNNRIFYPPRPYPSWKLDSNFEWQPPIQREDGKDTWDEKTLTWVTLAEMDSLILQREYEKAIDGLVHDEIAKINRENKTAFEDDRSFSKYTIDPSYPQYAISKEFLDWNSAVWSTARAILEDVEAGNRVMPTIEELIAELPERGA